MAGISLLFLALFVGLPKIDEFKLPELLKSHRGDVILVNFWATWCGPCREEFPDLVKLYDDEKDRGLVIVTISMDEPEDEALALEFLEEQGAEFESYLRDFSDFEVFVNAIDPKWSGGLPATFIFDRGGDLAYSHTGKVSRRTLLEQIAPLLAEVEE